MEKGARNLPDKGAPTWKAPAGEDSADATTFGEDIREKLTSMFGAAALGLRTTLTNQTSGYLSGGYFPVPAESYNERDARLREAYMGLLAELSSLPRAELQPGQRREAMSALKSLSAKDSDVFLEAFERVFHTESRKITDRARASALRFSGDFISPACKSEHVSFLINRLASRSPSQASAAAVSLGEIADVYSAPAISAAMNQVIWPSVRQDLSETLDEIKGND